MSSYILLVFEGQVTEKVIWDNLSKFYFKDLNRNTVISAYCNEIYAFYHSIKDDSDIDVFVLLKNMEINKENLSNISRDEISEIFLFFDYDAHSSAANDEKIKHMLGRFNNETEDGKLYISYPMVESIKHLKKSVDFSAVTVPCKKNIKYKGFVAKNNDGRLNDLSSLKEIDWNYIIGQHCFKLNYLINNNFELPVITYTQLEILEKQIEKHVNPKEEVSVLSAFPIFALDYYGVEYIKVRLS